jgi:hypothetical protein
LKRGDGIPVDGGYDPLLEAEYQSKGEDDDWWDAQTFDGKYLEALGFKPKSRVFRSVTPEDKEVVRQAVVALRKGTAQMPMGSKNLAYYLGHHALADRFTPSESVYILSQVVADQNRSYEEEQVLLNEREEEDIEPTYDAVADAESFVDAIDFFQSDMSPEDTALADELMKMLDA